MERHEDVTRAEVNDFIGGYLVFAREVAKRDMAQACVITGLSRRFLEILTQTTTMNIRRSLSSMSGTVVFIPRFPTTYWDSLARSLKEGEISDDMLAGYAAALSAHFTIAGANS
ncbi:MAG: hypothetical protein ACYDEV_09355 [Acidiferrobacter sp.]